jgi:hypothetical protein
MGCKAKKPSLHFPLCSGNGDSSLTTEYPFTKYILFVIVMSKSVCSGTPRPAEKAEAMKGGERKLPTQNIGQLPISP